jgi:hypothetical protein
MMPPEDVRLELDSDAGIGPHGDAGIRLHGDAGIGLRGVVGTYAINARAPLVALA